MAETETRTLDDLHALGGRIAALRRAGGWSQRRLAEAAGVSHGYIALLERGRLPSPGKFRLDAVARALNLRTADALLSPSAEPSPEPPPPRRQSASPRPRDFGQADGPPAAGRADGPPGAGRHEAPPRRGSLPAESAQRAAAPPRFASEENVLGRLEQVRAPGAVLLPVFRWGSCGDPRDRESPPDPDHLEYPPPGRETLIGPSGLA